MPAITALSAAPRQRRGDWGLPAGLALGVAAAGVFAFLLLRAQELPTGPAPVAWDKVACAHCRMHVGEARFAAQLQLADGRVLDFDDPGCLFSFRARDRSPVHATYFHHHTQDRWLTPAEAGFVPVMPTPMGFGLAAVDAATPGALTADQAAARVSAKEGSR
jgi:hypothetical protein